MAGKRKNLAELCKELNVAIQNESDVRCSIVSPRPLTTKEKRAFESLLVDFPRSGIVYRIGIKEETLSSLKFILISNKIPYMLEEENRVLKITISTESVMEEFVKGEVTRIFKEDGYPVGWSLAINGEKEPKFKVNFQVLEAMQGRDTSKGSIDSDDLMNLRIALETSESVDDFIRAM